MMRIMLGLLPEDTSDVVPLKKKEIIKIISRIFIFTLAGFFDCKNSKPKLAKTSSEKNRRRFYLFQIDLFS
jgi:hypothetical protein